jgi:methyl-accepting chemotaxis protein
VHNRYKPLRDASGKISGMLYVGVKEQSDARLVKSIASYSNSEMKLFVIDDGGNMVFGGPAGSDGKQAAAAMGLNVLSQVPDKAKPGAVGSLSYETNGRTRLLTWIPFPGWRWIICADIDMTRWRETNIAERLEVMKSEINAVHGASFVTRKDGAILDYLTQIRVFDAKGSELLVMKTGNFEKKLGNRAGTEWYEAALKLKKEQVSFSRLELSLNTKLPELRISSPIYEKNALRGLVVFNLDWEAVGELLARDKPAGGGYFFVVDPDGVLVSHPKHSLKNVFSLTDEKNNEVGDQLRKIAREEMTKGKAGFARYAFDGVEKFVAYEPLKIGDYSYSVCAGVSVKDSLKLVEDLKKGAADNSKAALLWVVVAFLALAALGLLAGLALGAALAGPLRRISASMKDESANVQAASLQISSASAAPAEGASRQAAGIEEISASIAQIGAMLKRSADNARGADALSKEADQAAEGGLEAMRLMGGAMARINESAVETSKIAKTIEEIAFQTNLLALNAAVEAARAGDAGRGFAVVAEEVRSLAQRSAQAARETARLIDESKASAKEGVVANEKAHERIASIKESFEKVRALVEDIANGVKEQSAGVDQISKSVVELEGVTQSNAASAEETAASANQLAGNAERLDGVVGSLTELVEGEKTAEGAARRALASTPECKNAALEDNASRKRLK